VRLGRRADASRQKFRWRERVGLHQVLVYAAALRDEHPQVKAGGIKVGGKEHNGAVDGDLLQARACAKNRRA